MKPVASGTIRIGAEFASERMGNDSPTKLLQTEKNDAIASVFEEDGENGQSSEKHGDTVSISEQGREKAGQTAAMKSGSSSEDDENAADKAKEAILKQIREVKAKLQDAQARLAQVQGGAGASKAANKSEDGEESTAAATDALGAALGGNAEAEVIQGEIESLNQQLQTLNQQLLDMSKGGGGSAAGGIRAGIGGESNGPSGQGQRISVKA